MRNRLGFMTRAALLSCVFAWLTACAVGGDSDTGPSLHDAHADVDATASDANDGASDGNADVARDVSLCTPAQTDCSGHCADLRSDTNNCGACGTMCPTGQFCDNGSCALVCNAPRQVCGSVCTDTMTDPAHCGTCGVACAPAQSCAAGHCACPTGQTLCGTACVDTTADPMNCGMCGVACPSVQHCAAGACICSGGQMLCGSVCLDASSDPMNCGACGNACPSGQMCTAGACACPAGQTSCSSVCVDTRVSTTDCGSCGHACGTGQFCSVGTCYCSSGQVLCGGACTNVNTDLNNCGACGTVCPATATCTSSTCVCPGGLTVCGTSCVDVASDDANCGTCGNACTGLQHCNSGTCSSIANDECATATAITLAATTASVSGTTVGATASATSCGGADVWFSFTLTQNEMVYVDTFGAGFDTHVGLVNACGSAATCNDNACGGSQSQVAAVLGAGTHYIVVGGATSGAFTIHVQHVPVPGPVSAALATSFTVSGNTTGAATAVFTCGYTNATPTVSYYWLTCPTTAAGTASAATCTGTTWDTVLEFTHGDGSVAACNDDACSLQSTVTGPVAAGAGLHVLRLKGYGTSSYGAYTITGTHP